MVKILGRGELKNKSYSKLINFQLAQKKLLKNLEEQLKQFKFTSYEVYRNFKKHK